MDIHAPLKPFESLRDAIFHLFSVTVGILIALSFEGLLEWRHNRHLVAEARMNITSEIRDNQKELGEIQAKIPTLLKNQAVILAFIQDVRKHGKSKINSLELNFHLAQLTEASWTTAQTVGALAFMEYA